MLRIGLTGGIGSGKTTVADFFSELGIEIIDADEIVHKLSRPGNASFDAILHHFGKSILTADGSINRQALGRKVFNNTAERKILEGILHPAVRLSMHQAVEHVRSAYCILVIPLLVETGFNDLVDRILVITADSNKRKDWIKQRSGLDNEQIEAIMSAQASEEDRRKVADDIIANTGSLESLRLQVEKLDQEYRTMPVASDLKLKT
jgi:dephospho-CoA kinase